jgi:hypothetical protein
MCSSFYEKTMILLTTYNYWKTEELQMNPEELRN